ncbi:integrase core domain-containing protein [Sulfitobacter sp. LCG007]
MMERLIRSPKERGGSENGPGDRFPDECVHRQRFESLAHASRAIGIWIAFYNTRRPHQALGMKKPAATFELAA